MNKETVVKTRKRWVTTLAILGVLVLAALLGGAVRWWQQYQTDKREALPGAVASTAQKAQNIAFRGDYDRAHGLIDDALDNPQLSSEEKHDLLLQKGITYEDQQDYEAAIDTYYMAEATQETQAVAEAIARVAEMKGDKDLAISYYRKAINRISKTSPTAESTADYYKDRIISLGGTP